MDLVTDKTFQSLGYINHNVFCVSSTELKQSFFQAEIGCRPLLVGLCQPAAGARLACHRSEQLIMNRLLGTFAYFHRSSSKLFYLFSHLV